VFIPIKTDDKNMLKYLLILTFFLSLASCGKKKEWTKPSSDDFESLSGKDLPAWNYIQTKEDWEHLGIFKGIYEARKAYLFKAIAEQRIPKVVHFIWIGPKPFPRASVENVRGWMAKHPDWTFKFWTDRKRPLPCPGMELHLIKDLPFLKLQTCFLKSDSYGEKSDLLRYEILYREGGVYVDHDVKCMRAFDPLNQAYDFYCGIDMPYTSSLPSCIFPTNNLIGIRPNHPILFHCMETLAEKWDAIGEDYPGSDVDEVLNRTLHRTFWHFGEAIKRASNQENNRDIVFPAYYFDAPDDSLALWARHLYAGAWHEDKTPFEKMVRHRLMLLSKKSNKTLLFVGVLSGLNMCGFIALFSMLKKKRQQA
jgi:hypothetical protein